MFIAIFIFSVVMLIGGLVVEKASEGEELGAGMIMASIGLLAIIMFVLLVFIEIGMHTNDVGYIRYCEYGERCDEHRFSCAQLGIEQRKAGVMWFIPAIYGDK